MTATETKIACSECRHENEPERIYCHNCGARLDRTVAIRQKAAEDPQETHRRLQKMLGPPNQVRRNFFAVSKLVLAAAIVAALVQIALPPDVPPQAEDDKRIQKSKLWRRLASTVEWLGSEVKLSRRHMVRLLGKKPQVSRHHTGRRKRWSIIPTRYAPALGTTQ